MKTEPDKMAIAAKAINNAIAKMDTATFEEIVRLYTSSFIYTTVSLFEDDKLKLEQGIQFFKDAVAEMEPEKVSEILDKGWEKK